MLFSLTFFYAPIIITNQKRITPVTAPYYPIILVCFGITKDQRTQRAPFPNQQHYSGGNKKTFEGNQIGRPIECVRSPHARLLESVLARFLSPIITNFFTRSSLALPGSITRRHSLHKNQNAVEEVGRRRAKEEAGKA